MTVSLILAAAAAAASSAPSESSEILVTAALEPVSARDAAVSATVFDQARIDALGTPLTVDLLRLAPGVAVSVSGGPGSLSEIRIRGAEARHSLLFIDGIDFNDVAASNTARFETMANDGLGRIEVVTGPQSALWGSEALGGVIALESPDPLINGVNARATAEYGSHDSRRGSAVAVVGSDKSGISASASWLKSDGIDVIGGGNGDKDGYENFTVGLKAVTRPGYDGELGIAARYINADTEFDGTDPNTFLRADTADASKVETGAVRVWGRLGLAPDAPWSLEVGGQYLHSENRNRDGDTPLNNSKGDRLRVHGQLIRRFQAGGTKQTLIARVEREDEDYTTRDQEPAGSLFKTDKDVTRGRTAIVGQWRADWGSIFSTDFAVRHDTFNRFKDATTWRGNAVAHLTEAFSVHGGYGEGISQPSFVDLFGFFPGLFIGNPDLKPERSKGYEAGVSWDNPTVSVGITAFSNRLENEIVTVFDSSFNSTSANATGKSRRRGIEATAEVRPLDGLRVSANYTYLDAQERKLAGGAQLKEARRPKHTANLLLDYQTGPVMVGGSLAYVGKRRDTDFDLRPAPVLTLKDYVLAGARVAYAFTPNLEAFARIENAFDEKYQDVIGYATPGRTAYAGIRVRFGD